MVSYNAEEHADALESFRSGPMWDELLKADRQMAELVLEQKACTVVQGRFPDPESLDYLRDTIGLVTFLMDHGGVVVYDLQTLALRTAEEWRERVFEPAVAVPLEHVVILHSANDDGTEWFHTLGMRKFGRPDLSFDGVGKLERAGGVRLFEHCIREQAMGWRIADGAVIGGDFGLGELNAEVGGDVEDLDFNNFHVEFSRER